MNPADDHSDAIVLSAEEYDAVRAALTAGASPELADSRPHSTLCSNSGATSPRSWNRKATQTAHPSSTTASGAEAPSRGSGRCCPCASGRSDSPSSTASTSSIARPQFPGLADPRKGLGGGTGGFPVAWRSRPQSTARETGLWVGKQHRFPGQRPSRSSPGGDLARIGPDQRN